MNDWRVGIDTGGTFTDIVAVAADGRSVRLKVPSTPRAPSEAVLDGLRVLLARVDADAISFIGHATTIGTNALLGQVHLEFPHVAFLTTAGFRDVVEIGRQNRSSVYDLGVRRPRTLAPRELRFGVRERIAHDGAVLTPLDDDAVAEAIDAVRASGAHAVAIGFLNSHRNDAHERRTAAALRAALPDISVTASSELVREEREYERFSTALVNVALVPIVGTYLMRLGDGIARLGIGARTFAMQSSGGLVSLETAAERPATLIESGPAAGVIAAAALARELELGDVLSFDMGGTTAKAGTIRGGHPEIAYEFEAAGVTHSGRATRGSGYPVRFPFVDLAEVSAGGGTIASLDAAGVLRVGPLSAGADPGPAAYGRGDRPTVTDANVVLGRQNPRALLGGTFAIDASRARDAIATVATPFDGDVVRAAAGVVALVDAQMAKSLRIVTVERGLDPRDFTLVAFGGGGPLHACALASEVEIARIVIPRSPGLFSAHGLVAAPASVVRSLTLGVALDTAGLTRAHRVADELLADAEAALDAQGVATAARRVTFDLRYAGQSFDLGLDAGAPDESAASLAERFHGRHAERYGYAAREDEIEIATVRVTATGADPEPSARPNIASPKETAPAMRDVWSDGAFVTAPVYARDALPQNAAVAGPAVLEDYDATVFVARGWSLRVRSNGALELERS